MIPILLIRHGRTAWNIAGRIQGRTDTPLSEEGRAELAGRAIPAEFRDWTWFTSPLRRAIETAALLGVAAPREAPELMEMDWGEWEGRTLGELRAENGAAMAENEARGIDFRPTGGESPREVRRRLKGWLQEVAKHGQPAAAVTHKGVIRAALSHATGWELIGKPPHRLDWGCGQLFSLSEDGTSFAPDRLNISLERSSVVR